MTTSTPVLPDVPLAACRPAGAVVDPLPLPQPGWGAEQAREAVAEAALAVPCLDRPLRLVRALSTVVFSSGEHAVKVHPPGTDAAHLAHVHAVLTGAAPVVHAVAAPVTTSHGVVTVAPWLATARPAAWGAVGRVLRRLHDLPTAGALPPWSPLRRLPAQLEHLPAELADVVRERREVLLDRMTALVPVLPPGAVHGDVSPENVLRTGRSARWIDLDLVAHGLREYDLSAVVRRWTAGQISDADYQQFVAGYGLDLRGWPGLHLLDELCALSGLGFRLWTDRCAGRDSTWLPAAVAALPPLSPARAAR